MCLVLGAGCNETQKYGQEPEHDASTDPVDGDDSGAGKNDAGLDAGEEMDAAPPWPDAPALRNPVDLPDLELGKQALTLMGAPAVGADGSCSDCHSIGRSTLSHWRELTAAASEGCLKPAIGLDNVEQVDAVLGCIRTMGNGPFEPKNLGIYSAAAHLGWFSFAFEHTSGAGAEWQVDREDFLALAGMPREGTAWTQPEFDIVAEWFERGLPGFTELVPPADPTEPCEPSITPDLIAHVDAMKTQGWRAKHKQNAMLMYGCQGSEPTVQCLSELPRARDTAYGAGWDVGGSSLRVLHDNSSSRSWYWSRGSMNGRYLSSARQNNEQQYGAQMVDLQRGVTIDVNGGYDPGFFPDGKGFVFQQGPSSGRPFVCNMSLLADDPAIIEGTEEECRSFSVRVIGIYEQLATSLDGGDYWVAAGLYAADDEGFGEPRLRNLGAAFEGNAEIHLTPMRNEGNVFTAGDRITLATPSEGDPILSPSGKLLITRVAGETEQIGMGFYTRQNGYRIYKLTTTNGAEGPTASVSEIARVCADGAKPMVSLDERWGIYHKYVVASDAEELGFSGPDDPAFAPFLERGGANSYLLDLKTGRSKRITNVKPGQYALYPHFRADGWIYLVVRTLEGNEYFVASDAALLAE
jgi:hypothetical protein